MSQWQSKRIASSKTSSRSTSRRKKNVRAPKKFPVTKWVAAAVVLLGVLFVAIRVLPRVTITLIPDTRLVEVEESIVLASEGSDLGELESKALNIRKVSLPGDVEAQFRATGEKDTGVRASGEIVFFNFTGLSHDLFVEDGLETIDGIEFTVNQQIRIPAASVSSEGEVVPGKINAHLLALEPGEESNIKKQKIFIKSVSPDKQHKIYGENTAPLVGGTSNITRVISEEDIKAAQQNLRDLVTQNIQDQIRRELTGDEELIEETFVLVNESFNTEVALDEELEEFNYRLSADGEVVVYNRTDLDALIRTFVEQKIQPGEMIIGESPNGISFEEVSTREAAQEVVALVASKWPVTREISILELKNQVLGQREADARRVLLSHPAVTDVRFDWGFSIDKKVPTVPTRVTIRIGG